MLSKQKQDRQPALADSDGLALLSRPARIGIDAVWAGGQPTGTGIYSIELVQALLRLDSHDTYLLYFGEKDRDSNPLWRIDMPNVEKHVVGPRINNLRNQTLARHLYRDHVDLFHSLGFFLPYAWLGRKVVTLHDVNYLRFASKWMRRGTRGRWLGLFVQTPLSAYLSRQIITGSNFSAEDIVRSLHVSRKKVHIVPYGVRSSLMTAPTTAEIAAVVSRYQLGAFVLSVGILAPQKNLERLIRAFALAAVRWRVTHEATDPLKLVIVGKDRSQYADQVLRPLARSLGCEDNVVFTGYLDDKDVAALYATARCVAQVSLAEGFGLPIAEAMHCGAPVVAANATGTVEAAGDAALLVDPEDEAAMSLALSRLCEDEELRLQLRTRGSRQAEQFTWDAAARRTLDVYRQVLRA